MHVSGSSQCLDFNRKDSPLTDLGQLSWHCCTSFYIISAHLIRRFQVFLLLVVVWEIYRERGRENPVQPPHHQHWAQCEAQSYEKWDHDLHRNQQLDTQPTGHEPPRCPRIFQFCRWWCKMKVERYNSQSSVMVNLKINRKYLNSLQLPCLTI